MVDFDAKQEEICVAWDSCDSGADYYLYNNFTIMEAVEDVCSDIPEHDEAEMSIFVDDELVAIANGNIEGYDIAPIE